MYKVEFNKSELENHHIPSSSKCILAVSMGVEAYEKHKLIGILKLINAHFQECVIIVGDTLNRYNFCISQCPKENHEALSLKKGDDWLNRNLTYIVKELSIPFKVIRWNSFINAPNFSLYLQKIEDLYQTNNQYKTVFDNTAIEFLNRQDHPYISKDSHFFHECLSYLKEEAAAMFLWIELNCEYEIYYNKRNGVMQLVYEDLLKPAYPSLLQPISLRFKKKKDIPHIQEILDTFTLKNIVETLPGHIFWKNKDGVYLGCNMQQALYYGFKSPDEVINKTDHDILNKTVADQLRKNDLKIMKENKHIVIEEKDNGEYFLSSKSSVKNLAGESVGVMGCSINITQQKILEHKLKIQTSVLSETINTKTRFLNNLSHEIRTPIHVMSAIVNELHEQFYQLSDEEKLGFIKLLCTTTQKALKLIKNIMSLAKGKKGTIVTRLEKVNMIDLVKSIIEETLVISRSNISIDTFGNQEIYINCTKYQIEQVVRNLLENAIKYGQSKPITVTVSSNEENTRVEVIDEGIAVPENEQVKIFEAFEESSRTKTTSGGMGLGLAICRDIVDLHRGKIWVESDGNVGSKFIFTLPVNTDKNEKVQNIIYR